VMRLLYDSKKMEVQCIDVNQKLQELFTWIDVHWNINTQIYTQDSQFYKALIFYFNLILQVRNSDSKSNKDYISCPVCYFHSDDWFQWKKFNADANGAYNIARKGIIMLNNIEANFEKPNLYVSDEDWDNYLWNFQLNNILQVIDA
jgi:CRISPR-associated protein Cpf1